MSPSPTLPTPPEAPVALAPKKLAPMKAERPEVHTRLSPTQVAHLLFAATKNEPRSTPGMAKFFRALVVLQSYLIAILMGTTILTAIAFAPRIYHHLVVLGHDALPERVQYIHALDEPNLTHTAIINMAMNVVTQVLTFGFNNADERLLNARHLFTRRAWNKFARAYLRYGRLDKIKNNQQVLTAIATDGAVVVLEGPYFGTDRWVVQVPIITTYQAGSKVAHKRSVLQLTLIRASTLKHPEGVAIDGWEELAAGLGVRQGWHQGE